MSDEQPQQVPVSFTEDQLVGDYAGSFMVFANAHELVFDFLAATAGGVAAGGARLVRRVRVPIASSGEILEAVANTMTLYEQMYGPIRRPGIAPDTEQ